MKENNWNLEIKQIKLKIQSEIKLIKKNISQIEEMN